MTTEKSISTLAGIDDMKGVRFFEEGGMKRARLTSKAVEQLATAVDAINNTPAAGALAFKTLRRSLPNLRTNGGLLCDIDGSISALQEVCAAWSTAIAAVDANEYADIYRARLQGDDSKSFVCAVQNLLTIALAEAIMAPQDAWIASAELVDAIPAGDPCTVEMPEATHNPGCDRCGTNDADANGLCAECTADEEHAMPAGDLHGPTYDQLLRSAAEDSYEAERRLRFKDGDWTPESYAPHHAALERYYELYKLAPAWCRVIAGSAA